MLTRQAYTIIGLLDGVDISITQEFDGKTQDFAELLKEDIAWVKAIGYEPKASGGKKWEKPGPNATTEKAGPNLKLPGTANGLFSTCPKCGEQSTGVDGVAKSTGNAWSGFKCTHCGEMRFNKTR